MGFFSFVKKIFVGEDPDEKILDEARARHGIKLDAKDMVEMDEATSEEERMASEYDVWEDLKHFRTQFFLGSWANKKIHPIGEEKVKKQLEELEKKRALEGRKHEKEAETADWEKWKK